MKALSLIFVVLGVAQLTTAYGPYQRRPSAGYTSGYTSGYTQTSQLSSSSSSSSSSGSCCLLNSWAYNHMDEVRQFSNRLRQEYNFMSQGTTTGYSTAYLSPWSENIIQLTGKTASELDALSRRASEQLVTDMRKGLLSYDTISQPNYFEWKASQVLQANLYKENDFGQQQQQQLIDVGEFQPIDMTNYDEVKNFAYPAEVKVIDGRTYIVHKNCTETKKTTGDGTFENPLVSVVKRNQSIITNPLPTYTYGGNVGYTGSSLINAGSSGSYPSHYVQPSGSSSTTTVTKKKTIYDWIHENMEPSVIGYKPVVNVDGEWSSSLSSYKPSQYSPLANTNSDVETFSTGTQNFGYQPSYNSPGSTVTIRRYNKTIITKPDGTNTVSGSELHKKWVDGKLVYDTERPFGSWSVPRDEDWKREERERFFWFLNQGGTTPERLEAWERQQEERLLAMADRYHTTIEEIQEWHRKELERYKVLLLQYQKQNNDLKEWQRNERGRLDWLIHQNSVTREELERWQKENQDKLAQLARQYQISLDDLKGWQVNELERLYVYFNEQNNSMAPKPSSDSLYIDEQERLEALIRQHNATIEQLQNSIKIDQQKLSDLSKTYKGNVKDMEQWLKNELDRLGGLITEQRNAMNRISSWQSSERERLENILRLHRGSVGDLQRQIDNDQNYLKTLASTYHVSIEELEKWQRAELERLQKEGQFKLEMDIKQWQDRERANLKAMIAKNDLTLEQLENTVLNDKRRLESLAQTYKMEVTEIEEWLKQEVKNLQNQGLLKEVKEQLDIWQQKERERLQAFVNEHAVTVEELEAKIKKDQNYLSSLAHNYHISVEEVETWLKKEVERLQSEGLVKVEELKEWQRHERENILRLVQQNHLTIDEYERKLLLDNQRLANLSNMYQVEITELKEWIKKEGERLQNAGMLQIENQMKEWQKIEHDRLIKLINENNLSIEELEKKITMDQTHLYSLAHQQQVRVEEIEEWVKQEIKRLQEQGLLDMQQLKEWQTEWRGNLTNMVKERDFTVEEFHKWLLEDRSRLQALAMQNNVQIEELEQWVKNEEQRFVSMGLLKPNEKLTDWQTVERRYLERITQQQYKSTEQLEQRLRQDRELLEQLARQYRVQVKEVEEWMKKELARLRDDGQLQIDNLTAWQIAERDRLEALSKLDKTWSVEEFEAELKKDHDHMQKMAFQYHTSVEEIEKWISQEVARLQQQGKLNIEQLTVWQQKERERIINLLEQQSSITVEEFEEKIQKDRTYYTNLARQYRISIDEVETYIKKVLEELRSKGKFELEKLQAWQLVERDYIKQMISQYRDQFSTKEYEQKLLADRAHLLQLADHYHLSVSHIEQWMLEELRRLRKTSEEQLQKLSEWQRVEIDRLRQICRNNQNLTLIDFELQLNKDRARLQQLASQHSTNIEEIERWLKQQLVNLKSTGEIQVESLTKWQEVEQKNMIDNLIQGETFTTLERQLKQDQNRLQQLSQQYHVSVEEIETWMNKEVDRLRNSGLLRFEQLSSWQQSERQRLEEWLRQQNNKTTYENFEAFIHRDKSRLRDIADDYRLTVEEVESWIQKEAARLQLLGALQRPQSVSIIDEYHHSWENPQYPHINVVDTEEEIWKTQTKAHLQAIAQVTPMSLVQFEEYLVKERPRWEQFARQYHITVEEIESWLRQSAHDLKQQGLIHDSYTEEWQIEEQEYISSLINDRLRKQQQWSIEELERHLKNDIEHLQHIAIKYHITIEELEQWYKNELQHLLNQRKIISEHLVDWQRREKERIYNIVIHRPGITFAELEIQLLRDRATLNRLADEYHVTIEELEFWIKNELNRLVHLGLIKDLSSNSNYNLWQKQERERLRNIVSEISITEKELLTFIAGDHAYQQQLRRIYGCSLDELAPFQRVEAGVMQREGLFDKTELLKLEMWQQRERDRLYSFIKSQNFNMKNLKDWQRHDSFLTDLAAQYGITVQRLKDWHLQEFERLQQLAAHYKMTLNQLQDFRDKELRYLTFVMHKRTSTEAERIQWGANEAKRMAVLQRKTGLSGEDLLAWRRRLYLLCQGLISMDFGGSGGHESGMGSTNRTAIPQQQISKDRGDQPPNVYEETIDNDEPGLEGETTPATHHEEPSRKPIPYISPRPPVETLPGGEVQSGYRYTKKEYQFTVPYGTASASASADLTSSQASASVGHHSYPHGGSYHPTYHQAMHSASLTKELDQQFAEDLVQQQQADLAWNEKLTEDLGQQVQVEDLSPYTNENNGQQVQVEDLTQQSFQEQQHFHEGNFHSSSTTNEKQIVPSPAPIEVKAEPEPSGFWGKLKQKTSNIFG